MYRFRACEDGRSPNSKKFVNSHIKFINFIYVLLNCNPLHPFFFFYFSLSSIPLTRFFGSVLEY